MLKELFTQYKSKWWFWVGFAIFFISSFIISWLKSDHILGSRLDYLVLYYAGKNFSEGESLYGIINQWLLPYYYLPFMAMIFTTLSSIDFNCSAFIYYLINILLYPLIFIYILQIIDICGYQWKYIKIPFLFSFILSLRYFGNNYHVGQVNEFVLFFLLLGIINYLKNNEIKSLLFFSIASVIKIIPVVFLFWYIIKTPTFKAIYIPLLVLTFALISPIPFRGFNQTVNDLMNFYSNVIVKNIFSSDVYYWFGNQSLSAFLGRLLFHSTYINFHTFPSLNISFTYGNIIILTTKIILISSFIFLILTLKIKRFSNNMVEISLVFLFTHLVSSLTWQNHLVSMSFVFIPFFIINFNKTNLGSRILSILIVFYLTILNFNYVSIFGHKLRIFFGSFSLYFLMILFFYIYYYIFSLKSIKAKN